MNEYQPTAKLRWVNGFLPNGDGLSQREVRVLQQWWAPNVPTYMVDPSQGEWRDVEVASE